MEWSASPPGWVWAVPAMDAYRRRDYAAALVAQRKVNMPTNPRHHANLAAIYGQLGDTENARASVKRLLEIHPHYDARSELGKWFQGELLEHFLDGLRKAGLESGTGNS